LSNVAVIPRPFQGQIIHQRSNPDAHGRFQHLKQPTTSVDIAVLLQSPTTNHEKGEARGQSEAFQLFLCS
jgi:hypothetical protein